MEFTFKAKAFVVDNKSAVLSVREQGRIRFADSSLLIPHMYPKMLYKINKI
jgi:hypothetical protein